MSRYLRYVIQNLEPLRIADYASSQSGQTETLRFIPGSAVRGFVINAFAARQDFAERKAELFSSERAYLNAYLTTKEHTLMPSPKGFYEDKTAVSPGTAKRVSNVVLDGSFEEGLKRAGLGRECYLENGCIYYFPVAAGADMKIRINDSDQNMFRSEYMAAGQYFEGYIRLTGAPLEDEILDLFAVGRTVRFGNARSASLGSCKVVLSEIMEDLPYQGKAFRADTECYMMLLSDTAMRTETGELCGLNLQELEGRLGVEDLAIAFASTSTRVVSGYNRTWGARIPSMTVYEAGSVFHLRFHGTMTEEKMAAAVDRGFGERKTEGFGRVLFLKEYEQVNRKQACEYGSEVWQERNSAENLSECECETLKIAAAGYYRKQLEAGITRYIVDNKLSKGKLANSQLGIVRSILTEFRYQPLKAEQSIRRYFEHAMEKEKGRNIQKEKASVSELRRQIESIFEAPLGEFLLRGSEPEWKEKGRVMGIPVRELVSEEEEMLYKLELISGLLGFRDSREKGD